MRDIIVTLIVLGAIPYILKRPHIGIYVWSWLSYMNPHRLTWGFAYNFPFAMLTGVATILSFILSKDKKSLPITPVTIVLLLWVAWMSISTIFALNPDAAFWEWKRTIKIQLMTILTIMLIRNKDQLIAYVWVVAFSLGFFGIKGGLFVLATGGTYRVWGPAETFVEDNNTLALALIMIIPLMRFLNTYVENRWLKYAILGSIALTFFSIISSYSRGAFIAILAMVTFLILKSKKKFIFGVLLVSLLTSLLLFMPEQWVQRMSTLENVEEDASAMGRVNAWWFAYNLALDRPLVGGGFQTFTKDLFHQYAPDPLDHHDAHSIYFEVLGEHGFIGLFLFLLLGLLAMMAGHWIIKNTRNIKDLSWANSLAAMVQVSLVGYAIGGAFLGLAYYDLVYSLIAIMVITRRIVETELTKREAKNNSELTPISQNMHKQMFSN